MQINNKQIKWSAARGQHSSLHSDDKAVCWTCSSSGSKKMKFFFVIMPWEERHPRRLVFWECVCVLIEHTGSRDFRWGFCLIFSTFFCAQSLSLLAGKSQYANCWPRCAIDAHVIPLASMADERQSLSQSVSESVKEQTSTQRGNLRDARALRLVKVSAA